MVAPVGSHNSMPNFEILTIIGVLLLASLALERIGRMTRLPRVTMLVLFGILIGMLRRLAGKLTRPVLAKSGRHIIGISLMVAIITAVIVGIGLYLLGFNPVLALLFAGITTSTAPAATEDVVRRSGAADVTQ